MTEPTLPVIEHPPISHSYVPPESAFVAELEERRAALKRRVDGRTSEAEAWAERSFPVLSVLAPAATHSEGKVEYPGDPMCLYAALCYAVSQVQQTVRAGLSEDSPYNDFVPQWGYLPSLEERLRAGPNTLREWVADPSTMTTDDSVFDPRVWNARSKAYLRELVRRMSPRVVLISAVSPAHRYAIDIAATVKEELPRAIVVLGGRHADETMKYQEGTGLTLSYSATYRAVGDGRVPDVIDFAVAGDAYFALDLLLKAISAAVDPDTKWAKPVRIVSALTNLGGISAARGDAVITARLADGLHVIPFRGGAFDLTLLPSSYDAFSIRAHFDIFRRSDDSVQRTAQLTTTSACPYQCNFCSEGLSVVGRMLRYRDNPVSTALERVYRFVSYGAEALFFDDSVMFGGNTQRMIEFSHALTEVKQAARSGAELPSALDGSPGSRERLAHLQFGAQLTVEFLSGLRSVEQIDELLHTLRTGGCTYLYFGIESLAPDVVGRIHKNRSRPQGPTWKEKTWTALSHAKRHGIRVGAAVLFGLDGETQHSIDYTVDGVRDLIRAGLVDIASPSILTYHPGTALTRMHEMEDRLDYHSLDVENREPYIFFEEAYPGVVSVCLTEEDITYIHNQAELKWGAARNAAQMSRAVIPT
jgi:radical SAM superfamily enzyme YgiQ (UPF0313 family)